MYSESIILRISSCTVTPIGWTFFVQPIAGGGEVAKNTKFNEQPVS